MSNGTYERIKIFCDTLPLKLFCALRNFGRSHLTPAMCPSGVSTGAVEVRGDWILNNLKNSTLVTGIRPGLEGVCHLSYYWFVIWYKFCRALILVVRTGAMNLCSPRNSTNDIWLDRLVVISASIDSPWWNRESSPCPLQGRPPAKRSNTNKRNILKQCIRGIGNEYVTVIFPMIIHPCWSAMCAVMLISSIYKIPIWLDEGWGGWGSVQSEGGVVFG